jgi:mannose-6-phosphate isomerase-like protein (cupin superfamily)
MWTLLLIIFLIVAAFLIYRYLSQHNVTFWFDDLESVTISNDSWRKVLTTSDKLQVVAMATPPGESLGWEVHPTNDQFFRVESGECDLSVMPHASSEVKTVRLRPGMAALVPSGMQHNVKNVGAGPLRMYTIYGPPHHPPGTVDKTHADEILREKQ